MLLVPTLRVGTLCRDALRRRQRTPPRHDAILGDGAATQSVAGIAFPRGAWERGGRYSVELICTLCLFVFLTPLPISAGDKKGEKKKEEPAPILKKSDELKSSDEKDTKLTKSPRKTYVINFTAGKIYQIDVASKFFDTFLRLEDAKGQQVAFNDDADASTFDSRIVVKPAQDGDYKIIVASSDGKVGKFNLTVTEADKKTPLLTGSRFQGKPIGLNLKDGKATQRGELDEKAPAALQRYYTLFSVHLEKDKTYRFEAKADDAKTLAVNLFLEDVEGGLLTSSGFNKDKKDGVTARIVHKAAQSGSYRVIVTTKAGQQTGKFTLEVSTD